MNIAGSALMVLLALAALLARPRATANRALAGYCGGFGGFTVLTTLYVGRAEGAWTVAFPLAGGLAAMSGASLVALALVHPRRVRSHEARRVVAAAALAGAWALVAALLCGLRWETLVAYWRAPPGGDAAFAALLVGWIVFYVGALFALLLLTLRYETLVRSGRRPAEVALLCGALALYPAADMGATFALPDGVRPSLSVAWAALAVVLAILWLRNGRDGAVPHGRRVAWALLGATLAGMLWAVLARDPLVTIRSGSAGVARTVSAALLVFAIVRHQLLGIEVKVKWTLARSTVAAILLTGIFLASEGAQIAFGDERAWVGLLAGALLVFALSPLQRFAEGVAERALPGVKTPGEMTSDERLAVYRDQARAAWADGTISGDERRLLDASRRSLGLDAETALALEREAAP